MSSIPDTPKTLLSTLGHQSAQDDAHWARFDELYRPVIRQFIRQQGRFSREDLDDLAQDVMVRLVDVLRGGDYQRGKGRFRYYLSAIVHNMAVDLLRKNNPTTVSLESLHEEQPELQAGPSGEEAMEKIDRQWKESLYQAALRNVLDKTPLPKGHREIFLEALHEEDTAVIAARHNISAACVRQIKHRINERIAAHIKLFAQEEDLCGTL